MRKILAVLLMLIVSACSEGFEVLGRNRANDDTFRLEGGLSVEFCGIVRDLNAEGDVRECVFSLFMVTSEKDTQLNVRSEAVYDSFGRKFSGPIGVSIAGNGTPSEVIAEVPTLVWVVHRVTVSVRELPKFSRMKFWFNEGEVELRGKASESWEDWKQSAGLRNEALSVWLETEPALTEMYSVMRNAPDLSKAAKFRGHHYRVFYERKTWPEAARRCEEMGGHLVVITSHEEQEFIRTIYRADNSGNHERGRAWIGLRKVNGVFKWVTGEVLNADSYTYWASGEPDNQGDYVQFWKSENFWDDIGERRIAYICEWDY